MVETTLVTPADVRDFVENTSAHIPGVLANAVADELNARLGLVGDHQTTSVLTSATVRDWIAIQVSDELGQAKYNEILRANAV